MGLQNYPINFRNPKVMPGNQRIPPVSLLSDLIMKAREIL